jgi:hypothetical protein
MDHTRLIPNIVCYVGGTCGDLLSAMLDSTGCTIANGSIKQEQQRQRLKKPHSFAGNEEKDQYLLSMTGVYKSVPSHDLAYHIERKHSFLSVVVENFDTAYWAADRFKQLHRPHVWNEMQRLCGAQTVKDYAQIIINFSKLVALHTQNVVLLDSIVEGRAVEQLEYITNKSLSTEANDLYTQWLECQNTL